MNLPGRSHCRSLVIVSALLLLASCDYGKKPLNFESEYQAVLLDTGQVYYGKFVESSGAFLVFRDVFYIQSQVDPETKQPKNVFVKRGKEVHSPVRSHFNLQHVVMVEPVKTESKIGAMIKELESKTQ